MTILVLELSLPIIEGSSVNTELSHSLLDMWPKFLSYSVTFLMLGFMWATHLFQFSFIKRTDSVLTFINIIFLMLMSLLPFTTNMLGEYFGEQLPVLMLGAHYIACMLMRIILWAYVTGKNRLVDKDLDPRELRNPQIMLTIGIVIFIVGMAFSFVNTAISIGIYSMMIIFFIVRFTVLRRISANENVAA
jgi:uncharacterized membrane protein